MMRDKAKADTPQECDAKSASNLAASSVSRYFKEHCWKIISFFPNALETKANTPRACKKKKAPSRFSK